MATTGEAILGEAEELSKLTRHMGSFADFSCAMLALLARIQQQTPQTGMRVAATPEERRLFLLGVKALNYVAELALEKFGQPPPLLALGQRWSVPRVRKHDLSSGIAGRLSYLDTNMDLLMAMTQGDNTRTNTPSAIYRRTISLGLSTLDSEATLLDVAHEIFQLSSAAVQTTYTYDEQGFGIVLPALKNADRGWNSVAFGYVERTLTSLAHSHAVWFGCRGSYFQVSLWRQVVPGTDIHMHTLTPSAKRAQGTACVLYKKQPAGRGFALSEPQEKIWDELRAAYLALAAPTVYKLPHQATAAFWIVRRATEGRHKSTANVSWDYSKELLNTGILALRALQGKAEKHFGEWVSEGK